MRTTRVEKKQRLHKKFQGYASLNVLDGPPWSPSEIIWASGRRPRSDVRGFPTYGGLGVEIDTQIV